MGGSAATSDHLMNGIANGAQGQGLGPGSAQGQGLVGVGPSVYGMIGNNNNNNNSGSNSNGNGNGGLDHHPGTTSTPPPLSSYEKGTGGASAVLSQGKRWDVAVLSSICRWRACICESVTGNTLHPINMPYQHAL